MSTRRDHLLTLLGVFLASVALLALEITEVRVFSYSLDPLLVFSAISIALLGMGAGSVAVALRPSLARGGVESRMSGALLGLSVSIVIAHAIFARTSDMVGFGGGTPVLVVLVVPYFFGGAFLAMAMTRAREEVGSLYFANMVGSGVGGVIVYPLLRPLGAEGLVGVTAALAALAAFLFAPSKRSRMVASAVVALSIASIGVGPRLYPFRPDPADLYGVARAALRKAYPGRAEEAYEPTRELSRWDPVARIEVYGFPGDFGKVNGVAPMRLFAQDGGAGSMLVDLRGHDDVRRALYEGTVYGAAYALRPRPARVLIIGLGGAPDVLTALHHQAGKITGVEINDTVIEMVEHDFATVLDGPYAKPNVEIVHRDGRSYLEGTRERFDLVQMTGADTYAAGAAGAFMFSESNLYTIEAFRRAISVLSDDGVLSVIRFGLEPLRVLSSEIAALRSLGFEHPERHLIVVSQGIWVNVMLSKKPLGGKELLELAHAIVRANELPRVQMPVYDALGFGLKDAMDVLSMPGLVRPNAYSAMLVAAERGEERAFVAKMDLDFSPVTDDRPFFFQFLGPSQLSRVLSAKPDDYYARGLRAHLGFLVLIAGIAALLVLAPVIAARRRGERASSAIGYFTLLGFAYLLVELVLMQRCALFLGHPTYSVATTMLTLLVASGLGSAWSAKRSMTTARNAAFVVVALLVIAQLALPRVFTALLPSAFALRVLVLVLVTAPLGFAMGIPFPLGLRTISKRGGGVVAFALAVNAFASIVASLVAMPVAMFAGFTTVTFAAALLYALAALLVPREP